MGADQVPVAIAKVEIEKYCTNELGKSGQEKDELLEKIWVELGDKESLNPN